ncbi:MAG: TIM barrel protein [Bacteroidetes bacterium]|nr:TIM barrel protein [Bacteroidota bacterium]
MQVVVSTLAFMDKPVEEIVATAQQQHYAIEFSSGLAYHPNMETVFLNAPIKKWAHNYFPAPKTPFVLNLASSHDAIRTMSVAHCIQGLELSARAGAPFFSAHAGFCIDPRPSDLGNELKKETHIDREQHWKWFLQSLQKITEKAEQLNLLFLIENNVLAKMNVYADGTNPLLCVTPNEIKKMLNEVSGKNLRLLLDTAHLKVSAHTLGFDIDEAVHELKPYIECVHHSDNKGLLDTNDALNEQYWFLKHMPLFKDKVHVLEVKKQNVAQINQQLNLLTQESCK